MGATLTVNNKVLSASRVYNDMMRCDDKNVRRIFLKKDGKLGNIIWWFGGDSRWADRIVDMLPEGEIFVEPFGGGASVTVEALRRGKYRKYVLNDKDPWAYHAYLQVRDSSPEKIAYLVNKANELIIRASNDDEKENIRAFVKRIRDNKEYDKALLYLMIALPVGRTIFLARTERKEFGERKIEKLIRIGELLRNNDVIILNRDAFDVIRQYDTPSTVFYLDPPHIDHKNRGVYTYSFTEEDAFRLGKLLTQIKGKFVLKINPDDWRLVYSKVLRPLRGRVRVKRVTYKVNFINNKNRGKERVMYFVIKE